MMYDTNNKPISRLFDTVINMACSLRTKTQNKRGKSFSLMTAMSIVMLCSSAEVYSASPIEKYYNQVLGNDGIGYDTKADACDVIGPLIASGTPNWGYTGYYLGEVNGSFTQCYTQIDGGDPGPFEYLSYVRVFQTCPNGTNQTGPASDPCQPYIVEEKNNIQPLACVGNPINLAIGNKIETHVDYSYSSVSGSLEFERFYNSFRDAYTAGNLGVGWSHTYDRSVEYNTLLQEATVKRHDGKKIVYKLYLYNSVWRTFADVHETLEQLFDEDGIHSGWMLTSTDNSVEHYNVTGGLVSITDIKGNLKTISRINGLIDTVSLATGEYLHFSYDGSNRIQAITDHTGRVWEYQYDVDNNLEYAIYPDASSANNLDNPRLQYHYENLLFPNALSGVTDERGIRYANWEYDSEGKANASYRGAVTSILSDRIEGISIDYQGDTSRVVTTSRGVVTTYTAEPWLGVNLIRGIDGPACSSCANTDSTYEYDLSNNITARVELGLRTEYGDYDTNGNYGYTIEAAGTTEARRTDYTYDPRFRNKIATQTIPSVYTTGNKITSYTYDDFGNITSASIDGFSSDGAPLNRITAMQYNGPLSQLSQIDGPRSDISDVTTLSYHPYDANPVVFDPDNGRLLSVVAGNGVVIRDNLQYSNTGQLINEQRPNGLTLNYTYYPGNDRLETIAENDGTNQRITRWSYLASGEVETITTGYNTPAATTITLGYDDARRLTSITDALGHSISYTLDTEGNTIGQENRDALSVLRQTLTQTFDAYNRLESRIGANNQTTTFGYDANGNLGSRIDANNVSSSFTYDNLQRLITVSNAPGDLSSYVYDVHDNLIQVTDPNNNSTNYQYDDLGNLEQLTSPDTGITTYSNYDGAGNVGQMMDANNNITLYQYDALNRLTFATYQEGTTTQYVYDSGSNATGRISQIIDPSGTTRYQYNAFGEVMQLSQRTGSQTHATVYSYDTIGRLDLITYPSGAVIDYDYTSGRVSAISINGTPLLSNIAYYPFGPVESWQWGNGSNQTRSFDLDGQMSQYSLNGDNQSLLYDPIGNLQNRTNTLGTLTYGYDDLSRLTQVSGLQSQAFTYDANGNRSQLTDGAGISSYTIAANSNRLTQISGLQPKAYVYDNNGNITNDGTNRFVYNSRNRMESANDMTYLHNGLGQRVAKMRQGAIPGDASNDGVIDQADFDQTVAAILETATPSGNADCNNDGQTNVIDLVCLNNLINNTMPPQEVPGSTTFTYDLQGQLIGEYNDSGTAIQETVYLGNMPVATIKQGTVYYIHTDQLNTPRAISDTNNVTLWQWQSTPFGETAANEDVDGDGVLFGYNLRFPGQYFDQETGLHYNYFRDYDPSIGRYVQSDPVGILGGLNGYAYVRNNPSMWSDPLGLWPWYLSKPTQQQKQTVQTILQQRVPSMTDAEAEQIINDSIDETSTGDVLEGAGIFPSDMQLPKDLSDLNQKQKDFIKDFLDDLPDRNESARNKIIEQCK